MTAAKKEPRGGESVLDAEMQEELKEDFAQADGDYDGRIDFREFVEWWTET